MTAMYVRSRFLPQPDLSAAMYRGHFLCVETAALMHAPVAEGVRLPFQNTIVLKPIFRSSSRLGELEGAMIAAICDRIDWFAFHEVSSNPRGALKLVVALRNATVQYIIMDVNGN